MHIKVIFSIFGIFTFIFAMVKTYATDLCLDKDTQVSYPLSRLGNGSMREDDIRLLFNYLHKQQSRQNEIPGVIDYSNSKVSEIKANGTKHIDDVLNEITERLTQLRIQGDKPVSIYLKDNYLTDEGIQKLCRFILQHDYLKNNLENLDLSNNRFRKESLRDLKNLIESCPKLTIDIAINYMGLEDLKAVFTDPNHLRRVKFSTF